MAGVEVNVKGLENNPCCLHGPTLLFSRMKSGKARKFFACSAFRNRKDCPFFMWEDEANKASNNDLRSENENEITGLNRKRTMLTKIRNLQCNERTYCHTCESLVSKTEITAHSGHNYQVDVTDHEITHPSELIKPISNPQKEAQYLFSESTVNTFVNILENLNLKYVICIGAPRIHECIKNNRKHMQSVLLDFDRRYFNFYTNKEFYWYNMFNNHFFFEDAYKTFTKFLKSENGERFAIVMDPPFGGRIEPLAATINALSNLLCEVNDNKSLNMAVFWIFPYFMEPHILNHLPHFVMLDYRVDYVNHPLFQKGPKGRKHGSPIRIFTNIKPQLIVLPKDEGYKFCDFCNYWVSSDNVHCNICGFCTSKDGKPYIHCDICNRCVKTTWKHCHVCKRCAHSEHNCNNEVVFTQTCLHCNKRGHKRKDCEELNQNSNKQVCHETGNQKRLLKRCKLKK